MQLFNARSKFVPTDMKEKWQELSVEYMTEESSDDEEDGCVIMLHKLIGDLLVRFA